MESGLYDAVYDAEDPGVNISGGVHGTFAGVHFTPPPPQPPPATNESLD